MFRVFNALGQITFAFAGHAVALEIQATIPSTPEKPSRIPMWKGAIGAYFINAICYFPVAFVGYWAFGQDVDDNVLMALKRPAWLIASANLMVVIHVIGSYQVWFNLQLVIYTSMHAIYIHAKTFADQWNEDLQVYAMPVFALLEKMMVKRLNFPQGIALRLIARSAYVGKFVLYNRSWHAVNFHMESSDCLEILQLLHSSSESPSLSLEIFLVSLEDSVLLPLHIL